MRITAQLNDAATGSHIWAEHYDRDLTDVFAVQDEITDAIVDGDRTADLCRGEFPQPAQAAEQRRRLGPGDAGAVASLARDADGQRSPRRRCWKRRSRSIRTMARRSSLLATNHMFGVHLGWADIATAAPLAERAALAAIAADSEDAWAHTALGSVYFSTRRLDDSLAEFELALQLNPNFSLAQGYYALALSYSGRWQDAYAAAQRAIRLSPRDPSLAIYYGVAAYAQFVGKNYPKRYAGARGDPSTRRSHRRLPGADGRRRHGRSDRGCRGRARRNCAGPSRIFRSPGSRPNCPGSSTPIASIISKAFAAPGSTSGVQDYGECPILSHSQRATASGDDSPSPPAARRLASRIAAMSILPSSGCSASRSA